tara:strand:+ start:91 stop:276 length:186 start_codon:yes stop_codon:yes gene_type:complete
VNVRLNLGESATAHLFAGRFVGDNGKSLNVDAIEAKIAEMDGHKLQNSAVISERIGGLGNV